MKISFLKSILLVLVIILHQQNKSFASHIVGGEMNYECLGNNQYRISLKIYRDCENGNPGAYFDNPVVIGIFGAQANDYKGRILINLDPNSNDTIPPYYPDSCISSAFCVHTTLYSKTVTLPFVSSGYILSYQRCCRAASIVNLIDPNYVGMTLSTEITAAALLSCNNSPTFNREIPFILGVNDTFSLDLGASDIDGDSLVYKFYDPFVGATMGDPVPDPPAAPPYNSVPYQTAYNAQMPFGNALCTWDSLTGAFVTVPTNLGTYILGFSILEYNTAGDLLSKSYKEIAIRIAPVPCTATINVDKIANASTIKVFPNPTSNNITIETENDEETILSLYSMQGQLLLTKSFRRQTILDLKQQPKGVYLLKFEHDNEQIVKRFIKQ